ncbi:hypothetical protein HMSSN139_44980 [Paenibacillus sp. HMSSN-139]|nr:hypothetical protein HMSSN139_44980 [Paenibacillus sp. HMSSN-139]
MSFAHISEMRGIIDARTCRAAGEPESGQGRDDHVKSILRVAAMAGRICKQRDDFLITKITVRPPMGKNQGQGIRPFPALMHEVDIHPVDLATELGEAV